MLSTQHEFLVPLVEVIAAAGGSMRAKAASVAIASRFEFSAEQQDECPFVPYLKCMPCILHRYHC